MNKCLVSIFILSFVVSIYAHDVSEQNTIIICNLDGFGNMKVGQDKNIKVEIEQVIDFNEDKVITFNNKWLSDYKFFQPIILEAGLESGWIIFTNTVSPNFINLDLNKSSGIKKFDNVNISTFSLNISINRLSGISSTSATLWYDLDYGDSKDIFTSEYSASGSCSKGINKF